MTFNLPPAIIRWLDMLETTQLRQGCGAFEHVDDEGRPTYCALGIFCLANGHPTLDPEMNFAGNWAPVREVLGEAGLVAVYRKNDSERLSFRAIAKWAAVYFSEHGPHIEARKLNQEQSHDNN